MPKARSSTCWSNRKGTNGAALKLMRKLQKKYGFVPDKLVTNDLRSYGAAASDLGIAKRHERGQGFKSVDPRKDFSQCMQQPTTHSTSNVISPRQERTEPSGDRLCRR